MLGKLVGPLVLGVLIASVVVNLWASARYFFTLRELYKFHAWEQYIASTQNAARSLATASVKYAKDHPPLEPILQRVLQTQTAPVPPQPGATPKSSR